MRHPGLQMGRLLGGAEHHAEASVLCCARSDPWRYVAPRAIGCYRAKSRKCQKCPRYNYTLYAIYGNADLGVQDPGREG